MTEIKLPLERIVAASKGNVVVTSEDVEPLESAYADVCKERDAARAELERVAKERDEAILQLAAKTVFGESVDDARTWRDYVRDLDKAIAANSDSWLASPTVVCRRANEIAAERKRLEGGK